MKWSSSHQFGHDALGPVINAFMARLHAYLRQCDDGDHKIFFALRAGLRIKDLYENWLSARGIKPPANMKLLKVSRLMAIKAAYGAAPQVAVTGLGQEMSGVSLNDIIRCILRQEIAAGRCASLPQLDQMSLHEFLDQKDHWAQFVVRYLRQQSDLYADYLGSLAGDANRLILVDSGWRGSSQLMLEQAFPNLEWAGVYFGCTSRSEILGHRPGPMHGLIFDSNGYQPDKPETAFLIHRHLIESLFEPGIASIEQVEPEDIGSQVEVADFMKNELREKWDDVYEGVRAYLGSHAIDPLSKIETNYHAAMERLADILCYPTKGDIPHAIGKMRSNDLGRSGATSTILPAKDRFDGDSAELRIKQAIWQTGQAVREYPAKQARINQNRTIARLVDGAVGQYCIEPTVGPIKEMGDERIAIITRTKDRPLLLRRAAKSVASQTFDSYSWVIVNDGGSLDDVQEVLQNCAVDPGKITICSNSESLGMEAASNVGIRSSESKYIVIHDDDDSWHPDFLKETVAFLRQNGKVYDGVITKTLYVSEEIQGETVIEHMRQPYNDWVRNIQISELVVDNIFPPIAFVFRRDIWQQLKGFDENLPVLGDWDFNLRFLMKSEIGVIPKPLAYYHHRDRGQVSTIYSNSVIGWENRHAAYNAIVRNKYIRLAGNNHEYAALAVLMGTGFAQQDVRYRIDKAREQIIDSSDHVRPAQRREVETLRREVADAKDAADRLQRELDRRWIMLHMVAEAIIRAKKLDMPVSKILAQVSNDADEYAASAPLSPPPDFNEEKYIEHYGDVAEAAAAGNLSGGFDHYIKHGAAEGRLRTMQKS